MLQVMGGSDVPEDVAEKGARLEPPSIQAFAVDTTPRSSVVPQPSLTDDDADDDVSRFEAAQARRTRRLGVLVGVPLALCVGILGLAAAREVRHGASPTSLATVAPGTPAARSNEPPPPVVGATPPPVGAALPPLLPDTPGGHPAPSTPSTGTLKVANAKQTLTVDGKRIRGTSVEVACGPHSVAVGREKPHNVDLACGSTLVVDSPPPAAAALPMAGHVKGKKHAPHPPHGHPATHKAAKH